VERRTRTRTGRSRSFHLTLLSHFTAAAFCLRTIWCGGLVIYCRLAAGRAFQRTRWTAAATIRGDLRRPGRTGNRLCVGASSGDQANDDISFLMERTLRVGLPGASVMSFNTIGGDAAVWAASLRHPTYRCRVQTCRDYTYPHRRALPLRQLHTALGTQPATRSRNTGLPPTRVTGSARQPAGGDQHTTPPGCGLLTPRVHCCREEWTESLKRRFSPACESTGRRFLDTLRLQGGLFSAPHRRQR